MKKADEERVAKNREKRLKKKNKKKNKSKTTSSTTATNGTGKAKKEDDTSDSDSSDEDGEGGARKKLKLQSGAPGVVFRGADEREQDDDQPREEEVKVKRIEEAITRPEEPSDAASQPQGLVIVDED